MVYNRSLYMDIRHDGAVFEAKRSDCRPVEPEQDGNPVEFKVGDRVVSWSGRQGVVEAINEIEGFPVTVRHSMREQVSYKLGGVKHDDRPVEPANSSEILDSSSEPLASSPCMDGVNVDQFIEGVMETRGRTSDPVNPSHYKHLPSEAIDIIEAAIAKAPSNQYAFLQGQVIKYLLRCWSKKGIEDLRKAKWYLDRLVGGFDDLLAEASGANVKPVDAKRYREPKLSDLTDGPIACECRGTQLDDWQPQMLFEMLRETAYPYRAYCPKNEYKITRWSQCRIEVGE
jgi:hypothetical protein